MPEMHVVLKRLSDGEIFSTLDVEGYEPTEHDVLALVEGPGEDEYFDEASMQWLIDPVASATRQRKMQMNDQDLILQRIEALEAAGGGSLYAALQLVNSDTTTGVNTGAATALPIDQTSQDIGSGFTATGNAIETDYDGKVRLSASIYMLTTTVQRASVLCQWARNGVPFGPKFDTSYIRRASGDNESSCACTPFLSECADGDLFTLTSIADAAAGAVVLHGAGHSYMLAERVG